MGLWRSGKRRAPTAMVASVAAAMVLAACGGGSGGSSTSDGKADANATLRIMYGMGASLDPVDAPEPGQLTFSTWPVYDRLLRVSKESTYEPMLATKWEFTPDGKTLSLTLRDGVTFSDGEKFDAEAVKANLDRGMAANDSALQLALASIASVEVTGDLTVAVHLKEPTTAILSALGSNLGGIMISPKALESDDLASHPVGTGAYTIESFKPGERVTYIRRTDKGGIWDPKTGKVAKVVVSRIASPDAKVNALKSGQIDLTTWEGDSSKYASQVSSGQAQTTSLDGVLLMVGIYLNPAVKPLENVKVRQAINLALDRDSIVKAFAPVNKPLVQPWPEGLPGFDKSREDAYPFDPTKAKELLAEAGYPDGFTISGDFLTSTGANIDKAAEAVQANLADIGVKIKLRNMDPLAIVTAWGEGKNPGQFQFMSLPSIDPYSWLQRMFVNPVWTPAGAPPELLSLIEGLEDPTLSEDDRAAKVGKVIAYATDNALYAPLWQGVGGLAASSKVKGLDDIASVNGGVADLRNTWLTK